MSGTKTWRFAGFLLLWLFDSGHAAGESVVMENERISVSIAVASGAVVAVRDKSRAAGYVNPASQPQILRLQIPRQDWPGRSLAAHELGRFEIASRGADSLTLRSALPASRASKTQDDPPELEIRYRLEQHDLVTQLTVRNVAGEVVDAVTFPELDLAGATNGEETVSMAEGAVRLRDMFSANTIRTQHDPFERLDPEDIRGWIHDDPAFAVKAFEYPSGFLLHTAWMHYRGGDLGLGFDVRDRSFQSQFAVVERILQRDAESAEANRRTYRLSWRWCPLIPPGRTWESPEVHLKFDAGDWHTVAKQHRQWLQTWLPRPEIAPRFRESIGWFSRGISSFDQIPAIARSAVAVGAPYVLLYGWYGSGMNGLSYDFFPQSILGGAAALRENLREARALGAYPLAWYNGTTTSEVAREHREQARDWVVVNRDGGYVVDGRWSLFDPDRPPTTDDTTILLNYDMGSEAAAFNIENVRRLIEDYGFAGFEMDQGAKNFPAYGTSVQAANPELRYTEGARRFYAAAKAIVKQHDPNGVILGEGWSDFMNQYVDSTWTFEGGAVDLARSPYARYSLPWVTHPAGVYTPDRGYANLAFMMNAPLDIFLDVDSHPDYRAHLVRLHALKRRVHTSLYDGDYSDDEGFQLAEASSQAVLAKSYFGPGNRLTVVVVNTSGERQRASLTLAATAPSSVLGQRLDGSTIPSQDAGRLALDLEPYDVNVVVAE